MEEKEKETLKELLLGNMLWYDDDLNMSTTNYDDAERLVITKSMFEEIMKEPQQEKEVMLCEYCGKPAPNGTTLNTINTVMQCRICELEHEVDLFKRGIWKPQQEKEGKEIKQTSIGPDPNRPTKRILDEIEREKHKKKHDKENCQVCEHIAKYGDGIFPPQQVQTGEECAVRDYPCVTCSVVNCNCDCHTIEPTRDDIVVLSKERYEELTKKEKQVPTDATESKDGEKEEAVCLMHLPSPQKQRWCLDNYYNCSLKDKYQCRVANFINYITCICGHTKAYHDSEHHHCGQCACKMFESKESFYEPDTPTTKQTGKDGE